MHQTAHVMAVTNEVLPKAPVVVQEYVKEFFKRTEVLGKDCWVAFSGSLKISHDYPHKNRGVAHDNWRRGLWDEIRAFFAANPNHCFDFHVSWDDGCISFRDDD
jgi:hypothetical protein